MKLRVRSAGRTVKLDLENDSTLGAVKEKVALEFGHDVTNFELSLNGREALEGDPDTPLSSFNIVSGDLLRIILTQEGTVQSPNAEQTSGSKSSQSMESATTSSSNPSCSGMDIDSNEHQKTSPERTTTSETRTEKLGTSISQDQASQPSTSGAEHLEGGSDCQSAMDEGASATFSVREPMLCRSATDCMIPQRLRALYLDNRPHTLDEALCIVLHVLMLETGFQTEPRRLCNPSGSPQTAGDSAPSTSSQKQPQESSTYSEVQSDTRASMPAGWRVNRDHKLSYYHPSCEGAVCSLACVPIGKVVMIHGLTSRKTRFRLQLKPSDYVTALDDQPMYTNLPQLSRLYKDAIAYPLLLTTRSELGLVPLNGLLALFPEIQLLILSFLDVRSLLNMSEVCQHFKIMAADRSLWRQLLLRDFGCKESDGNLDWKELYKQKYKNKKDLERYRRNLVERSIPVSPGGFFPPPPIPPTMPGYPPGYRGGDYDLDPLAGLAQPHNIPFRRDPRIIPFPGPPDISPFPDQSPSRDPILNPIPRVPNRRDPFGNGRFSGNNNRGFFF